MRPARGNAAGGRSPRRALAGLLGLALAAGSTAAAAQDGAAAGDDPFAAGAFESSAGIGAAAAPAPAGDALGGAEGAAGFGAPTNEAKIEYLVGGAIAVSASAYFDGGFDGYAASSSASGKVFAKVSVPDSGVLFASYSLRQAFFKALSEGGPANFGLAASLEEPTLELSELYYGFDIGKAVFLRLGKQLVAWGPSFFWTPVDFVNAERADPFAALDTRAGQSGLKLTIPLGSANLVAFADFSGLVREGEAFARDPADALVIAARADAALGGFEWGLSGSWGAESQAKAGFDFSGYLLGTTLYGEIAAAPGYSSYEAYVQAALGFSRALGDLKKWTLSGEGFFNALGAEYGAAELIAGYRSGALKPLYVGMWYANVSLKAQDLLFGGHDATLSATVNLSDLSFQARLAQDIDVKGAPPFSLTLAYSGGGEGKEFTSAAGDGAIEVSLRTKLEF
jgi:hypothetical protein